MPHSKKKIISKKKSSSKNTISNSFINSPFIMKMQSKVKKIFKGFTLIELIIVIAIIAILASAVFVAINPATRLKASRNATRWTDATAIRDAVMSYSVDNSGSWVSGVNGRTVNTTLKMIGTDNTSDCEITCGSGTTSFMGAGGMINSVSSEDSSNTSSNLMDSNTGNYWSTDPALPNADGSIINFTGWSSMSEAIQITWVDAADSYRCSDMDIYGMPANELLSGGLDTRGDDEVSLYSFTNTSYYMDFKIVCNTATDATFRIAELDVGELSSTAPTTDANCIDLTGMLNGLPEVPFDPNASGASAAKTHYAVKLNTSGAGLEVVACDAEDEEISVTR